MNNNERAYQSSDGPGTPTFVGGITQTVYAMAEVWYRECPPAEVEGLRIMLHEVADYEPAEEMSL